MPKYQCDECSRTFARKRNLEYHITHGACKDANHPCKYCDKSFTTATSMYRHMKYYCLDKPDDVDETDDISDIDETDEKAELLERIKQLEKSNNELKEKCKKMENDSKSININAGTINNVTNNVTMFVAYGHEDMNMIDSDDIISVLKTGFNSTKKLTEAIHFNPKYPQFSNIKRNNFNMKNKIMYHNGAKWITTSDPNMIDDLYNKKREFIEENFDDYRDKLTKYDIARLKRWLSVKDDDYRITRIKDELRELLFNNKNISEMNEKMLKEQSLKVITDMNHDNNPERDLDNPEQDLDNLEQDLDNLEQELFEDILDVSDNLSNQNGDDPVLIDASNATKNVKKIAPRNGRYRKTTNRAK